MTDPTPTAPEPVAPRDDAARDFAARDFAETVAHPGVQHDPWSRHAETVRVSPDADYIVTFAPAAPAATPRAPGTIEVGTFGFPGNAVTPKRRRRLPIVLSVTAVLIVLLGAGAYAGIRAWTGSGITEPEFAVPASVTGFARVDLNPGLRDRSSLNNLVKKFPARGRSAEDFVTKIENSAARSAGLDFATDVKPWFGGQAGVAEWPGAGGRAVELVVFSSKDDAAAKAALTKAKTKDFGFVLSNGYALVAGGSGDVQSIAASAAAQAKAHSLGDSAAFTSAASHIPSHNLLLAYLDLGAPGSTMGGAFQQSLRQPSPAAGSAQILGLANSSQSLANAFSKLAGRVIIGASVAGGDIEVHAHADGLGTPPTGTTDVSPTVAAMSSNTVIGLAFNGEDPGSDAAKQFTQTLGHGAGALPQSLAGPLTSVLTAKMLSISLTGIGDGKPIGSAVVDLRDAAGAQSLLSAINGLGGTSAKATGTRVTVSMGDPPAGGHLRDSTLYKEAVRGMTGQSGMVYIDVAKLVSTLDADGHGISADDRAQLAPVKAIAIGTSTSGTSEDVLLRVVIK